MCEAEGRSARQGMSARGVLGEVCARGRSAGEICQARSARGGLPGEGCRGDMGGQGSSLPGQAREAGRGGLPGVEQYNKLTTNKPNK